MTFDLVIQIYLWGLIPAGLIASLFIYELIPMSFVASLFMGEPNDADFIFDSGITLALVLFWPVTAVGFAIIAVWRTITKGGAE